MEVDELLPPLPLEPPRDFGHDEERAPPPPPLQTSSDAEVMDVSSGGDGYTYTPGNGEAKPPPQQSQSLGNASTLTFCSHFADEASPGARCPRTARHAPPVTNFLPDHKLLRDVKISVSFTESNHSKDRRVQYTGDAQEGGRNPGPHHLNGGTHDSRGEEEEEEEEMMGEGSSGAETVPRPPRSEEAVEAEQENKVEFTVLDEFNFNFLDHEDGDHDSFTSKVIVQQAHTDEEAVSYSYEVCPCPPVVSPVCPYDTCHSHRSPVRVRTQPSQHWFHVP